jgi:hypothetical protein
MSEKLEKLERYFDKIGKTFRKKQTLKTYIDSLCDYLEIPRLKVFIFKNKKYKEEDDIHVYAYFSISDSGKPYMVFYKQGMACRAAKHEVVHYIQYLQDGSDRFLNPIYDEEYEIEAHILELCSERELKFRSSIRKFVSIGSKEL